MASTIAAVALLLSLAIAAHAHTVVKDVTIGGVTTAQCLRPTFDYYDNNFGLGADSPIMSSSKLRDGLMSQNYTCGWMPFAANAAAQSCSIAAGASISVSYYHGALPDENPATDTYISASHMGPFLAYLAPYSQSSGLPTGNAWFKIYQVGKTKEPTNPYNYQTAEWASPSILNANAGKFTFGIPSDIAPGRYLLRTEIIAMHDNTPRGAQPYVRCIDLTVTGGGSARPAGVAIPGAYSYDDPGITYDLYSDFNDPYPFPGPAVYQSGSSPSTTGTVVTGTTTGSSNTGNNGCDSYALCEAACGPNQSVKSCRCGPNQETLVECEPNAEGAQSTAVSQHVSLLSLFSVTVASAMAML